MTGGPQLNLKTAAKETKWSSCEGGDSEIGRRGMQREGLRVWNLRLSLFQLMSSHMGQLAKVSRLGCAAIHCLICVRLQGLVLQRLQVPMIRILTFLVFLGGAPTWGNYEIPSPWKASGGKVTAVDLPLPLIFNKPLCQRKYFYPLRFSTVV